MARARDGRYATTEDLAEVAGVSARTVEMIEAATTPGKHKPTTLAKIEGALGWQPGSWERIIAGGVERQEADPMFARLRRAWPDLPRRQQAAVVALVEALRE